MPDPVVTEKRHTPPPFTVCTECRGPLRAWYYALNERPVCGVCRGQYAALIARSEGTFAFWRVALQAAMVAAAGAVAVGAMSSTWLPLRFIVWAPIGYLIGKRIMAVVQKYSARRYQYLAVGLTYLSFLVGIATPMVRKQMAARASQAAMDVKLQGTPDEVALMGEPVGHVGSTASSDSTHPRDTASAVNGQASHRSTQQSERHLPSGQTIFLFLLLPLLSIVQSGMQLAVINVISLGAAFYFAWKQTDGQGWDISLSGPYKLGEGPLSRG